MKKQKHMKLFCNRRKIDEREEETQKETELGGEDCSEEKARNAKKRNPCHSQSLGDFVVLHCEHTKRDDERREEKTFKTYNFNNGIRQVVTTCREISNTLYIN